MSRAKRWGFLTVIAGLFFLISCSTSKIVIDIPRPSDVDIPEKIKKLALVKYRLRDDTTNVTNIIREMISGEGAMVEKVAIDNAMNGFREKIKEYSRFTITGLEEHLVDHKTESDFPEPLPWQEIKEICEKNNSDALVSLEAFSSSTSVNYSFYATSKKKIEEEQLRTLAYDVREQVVHVGQLLAEVELGWRFYYPAESKILFMKTIQDSTIRKVEANSKKEAERKLPGKKNAIEEASFLAGEQFAQLLNPGYTTVERRYFPKGNDDFKMAKAYVFQRYWDKAAELWERNFYNPDPKIASSAMYNMALIYEMKGKMDDALELAKAAWQLNQNKTIETYIQLLENRLSNQ
ncbi:MAG: tetratricopeptide repeat protein [Bacteroidales bacterium]|nr:tetratricopeptide repeat protein [Bacteroidales bacterium]